jgi:hypothetical protein
LVKISEEYLQKQVIIENNYRACNFIRTWKEREAKKKKAKRPDKLLMANTLLYFQHFLSSFIIPL